MNALELALTRLSKAVTDRVVEEAIEEAVGDALAEAADLNVEQLMRGENALGDRIEPEYASDEYARIKNAVNPEAGLYTPDLKAEGDFHDSIYAKKRGRGFEMDARDFKKKALIEKYGPILGLSPESMQQLMDEQIEPTARVVARKEFIKAWNSIAK